MQSTKPLALSGRSSALQQVEGSHVCILNETSSKTARAKSPCSVYQASLSPTEVGDHPLTLLRSLGSTEASGKPFKPLPALLLSRARANVTTGPTSTVLIWHKGLIGGMKTSVGDDGVAVEDDRQAI